MKWQLSGAGSTSLVLVLACALAGCETNAQTGTLVGAGAGAGLGAIIGNQSKGRSGEGALIGGAVGAIGGYMVGNEMDKAEQRKRDRAYENSVRTTREQRYEPAPPSNQISKKDIIQWTDQGVKDEIIIDRIERSGVVFRLTAADENELRDAGVSEEVVRCIKDTARR